MAPFVSCHPGAAACPVFTALEGPEQPPPWYADELTGGHGIG